MEGKEKLDLSANLGAVAEDDVGVAAVGERVADGQVEAPHDAHLEQAKQALHRSIERDRLSARVDLITGVKAEGRGGGGDDGRQKETAGRQA